MIGLGEPYSAAFALCRHWRNIRRIGGDVADASRGDASTGDAAVFGETAIVQKMGGGLCRVQAAALLSMPLAAFFSGSPAAICIFAAAHVYRAGSQASGQPGTPGSKS